MTMNDEKTPVVETTDLEMTTGDGSPLKTGEIEFRGRRIRVKIPDEIQIAIMRRFAAQVEQTAGKRMDARRAIIMSGRAIGVVQSVMEDEDDQDWIEDALLGGVFSITDVIPIIEYAMRELKEVNDPQNREDRRAAAKKSRTHLVTE